MFLPAENAGELMTPNPISIRADASVPEAVALMTDHAFHAAPVIDEAGRPVGVISTTDLLVHQREQTRHAVVEDCTEWDRPPRPIRKGFSVEVADPTPVRDVMTPVLFSVSTLTPVYRVVSEMRKLRVHHLFVTDEDGVLVGVISPVDILDRLTLEE
jgi:CBS domain-containing protein